MRIMIVSPDFPDDTRQDFKRFDHGSNIIRDVQAARNAIRHKNVPDLLILDNRLEGAPFFAKEVRSSHPETKIHLVVSRAMEDVDSERMGFDGYIMGDLTLAAIFAVTGDVWPPPEVEEDNEVVGLSTVKLETTHTPDTVRIKAGGEGERGRGGWLARLSFSAILGALALGLLLQGYALHRQVPDKPELLANLYGASAEEAQALCEAAGTSCVVAEAASEMEPGFVCCQWPPAGTPMEEVETVGLTVSAGTVVLAPEAPVAEVPVTDPEVTMPAEEMAAGDAEAAAQVPAPRDTGSSPPVVSVAASRTEGPSSGFMVTLTATASDPDGGPITSYSWSCGGSGPRVSVEMVSATAPAARTITCTVTDDEGQTTSSSVTVWMY